MPQQINFGKLTFKDGMNPLVGAPVETFAKVGSELTARYWKNRESYAAIDTAVSNVQTLDLQSHKDIKKQVEDDIVKSFETVKSEDGWHKAQNVLIDTAARVNKHEGLKLVQSSYAKKAEVDKSIDEAKDWSSRQKQAWKLRNDAEYDNNIYKDEKTGTYTGGYHGIGLPDYVSTLDISKQVSDIVGKFNPSSYEVEQLTTEGKRLGISDYTATIGGKTMSFDQFITSRTEKNKVLDKSVIADFIKNAMYGDNKYIQSRIAEYQIEMLEKQIDLDESGAIIKNDKGQPKLKPLDRNIVSDFYATTPKSEGDLLYVTLGAEQGSLFTKAKLTPTETQQKNAILKMYGAKDVATLLSSESFQKQYVQNATTKALTNSKGELNENSDYIASRYPAIKLAQEINNVSATLGNGIGYTETSSVMDIIESRGFGKAFDLNKDAMENATILTNGFTVPVNLASNEELVNEVTTSLNNLGIQKGILESEIKALEAGGDANGKYSALSPEERKSKAVTLQTERNDIQAKIDVGQSKLNLAEVEIQNVFNKAKTEDVGNFWNNSFNRFIESWKSTFNVLSNDQLGFTQAPMITAAYNSIANGDNFDQMMAKLNTITGFSGNSPQHVKEYRNFYNQMRNKIAGDLQNKLAEKGVSVPSVSSFAVVGNPPPAVQSTLNVLLNELNTGAITGVIASSSDPRENNKQTNSQDIVINPLENNISLLLGQEGTANLKPGQVAVMITPLFKGTQNEDKKSSAGTKRIVYLDASVLDNSFKEELIRANMININRNDFKGNMARTTVDFGFGLLTGSTAFRSPKSNISQIDENRSAGYNLEVIKQNLTPGDSTDIFIDDIPITIIKTKEDELIFQSKVDGRVQTVIGATPKGTKILNGQATTDMNTFQSELGKLLYGKFFGLTTVKE